MTASPANTRAAMPRYSPALMRPPRVKSREPRLFRRGIDEAWIDRLAQVDISLQDAGLARGGMDVGDHLLGEIAAELFLVLGQRIIDDAIEGGGQLLRLGADRFRN